MIKRHNDPQISETLNVIKKALEEDSKKLTDNNILILLHSKSLIFADHYAF